MAIFNGFAISQCFALRMMTLHISKKKLLAHMSVVTTLFEINKKTIPSWPSKRPKVLLRSGLFRLNMAFSLKKTHFEVVDDNY